MRVERRTKDAGGNMCEKKDTLGTKCEEKSREETTQGKGVARQKLLEEKSCEQKTRGNEGRDA
jgi:hypothetical protein